MIDADFMRGGVMSQAILDADRDAACQEVLRVTAEETAAIESGDAEKYLSLLSADAVFLPQNDSIKTGKELQVWMRHFLQRTIIHYLDFRHLDMAVRDDVAYHAYTCRWVALPKIGGPLTETSFKGVQILRRQGNGEWKIAVSIWNANPANR
jgi:ketosteroid isomerase-like protein